MSPAVIRPELLRDSREHNPAMAQSNSTTANLRPVRQIEIRLAPHHVSQHPDSSYGRLTLRPSRENMGRMKGIAMSRDSKKTLTRVTKPRGNANKIDSKISKMIIHQMKGMILETQAIPTKTHCSSLGPCPFPVNWVILERQDSLTEPHHPTSSHCPVKWTDPVKRPMRCSETHGYLTTYFQRVLRGMAKSKSRETSS